MIRYTAYGVIAEKRRMSIRPIFFRAPCRKNCALDRKICTTFLMVSTCSITLLSLGKIVLLSPAVGAKMWCLFFLAIGRIAAKRQTAGIKFTHRPIIRVFSPQGRLVAPIHVKRSAWLC